MTYLCKLSQLFRHVYDLFQFKYMFIYENEFDQIHKITDNRG